MQTMKHVKALKKYREELALEMGEINREREVKELEQEVEQMIQDKYKRKRENFGEEASFLSKQDLTEMYGEQQSEEISETETDPQQQSSDFLGQGLHLNPTKYTGPVLDEFYSSDSD